MIFYVGLDHPSDAHRFDRCMVSVNSLRKRKSDFRVNEWILDSGAFTQVNTFGDFRESPAEYAAQARRWARCGELVAVVTQDYMCEPFILEKWGRTVEQHQAWTVARYDAIRLVLPFDVCLMPVLQGYWPDEYVRCVGLYGDRLYPGMWVGVGSVCKRNANLEEIESVLMAVKRARPDLRLHGFGVKTTALGSSVVRDCLYSADSMAWSFAARWGGRNQHDWREAEAFREAIRTQRVRKRYHQWRMF